MDRKFKMMGVYIGLLFFAVILLVLVTSFSNTELNPSYDAADDEYQVMFNRTMEQSVNSLTENNEKLMAQVKELEKQISEKDALISQYEKQNSADSVSLGNAVSFYISGDTSSSSSELEKVNPENLSEEDAKLYNQLKNKLK